VDHIVFFPNGVIPRMSAAELGLETETILSSRRRVLQRLIFGRFQTTTPVFSAGARQPIPLTTGTTLMQAPVSSPDGKKLFAIGGQNLGEVVRYDANTNQFSPYVSGISAIQLGFSHDGQWVAYTSYPEGGLYRSKVDGSERLQLTSPPSPRFSPSGRQTANRLPSPADCRVSQVVFTQCPRMEELQKK
jgi:hypothetical protein